MKLIRAIVAATAFTVLAGCDVQFHPKQPGDTACLDHQVKDFRTPLYQAVDICGTPLPDLTGDAELQRYASAYNISYQYNPRLDAEIKRKKWSQSILIGTLIPNDYSLNSAEISETP
ncbi:MAG: hypothetical protein ACRYGI_15980 [Janthinobacterium lividum]